MRFIEKTDCKLSVSKWQGQLSMASAVNTYKTKSIFYFR